MNRNGYQHRFVIAPNNLSQTGLGIRGKEEFLPGWSVVLNASTGINPQYGLLANASATDTINNGLPSYRSKTNFTFSWYQQRQNDFRLPPTCAPGNFRASCAGTLNEGSLYADHHFTKRFDGFVGIAYSYVSGGLAITIPHGPGVPYNSDNNFAPTVGGRFTF